MLIAIVGSTVLTAILSLYTGELFHTLKVKKQPLQLIEGAVFLLAQIERLFFRHRQQLLCMFNG